MVEPLEAHQRIAESQAPGVVDWAEVADLLGQQLTVWEEAAKEDQPLGTQLKASLRYWTLARALKHPCEAQKSQCQCRSLLRTP